MKRYLKERHLEEKHLKKQWPLEMDDETTQKIFKKIEEQNDILKKMGVASPS